MNNTERFLYFLDGFLMGKTTLSEDEVKTLRTVLDEYMKKLTRIRW